jgi:beta-lactamase superfamily II metal-dependent hydrolase
VPVNHRPALSLLPVLLIAVAAPAGGQAVRIQVIDVGQADGILVRTPNGQWILIDAGQGTLLADSLPTQFGVSRLALAVGSHRHRDHIGGMDHVLNRIPTDRFLGDTTEYAGGTDDDNLRDTLRTRGIPVQEPGPDTLIVDGVRVIVLPRDPANDQNENNNTVPIRLELGAFSMLLVGDAEVAERDWLAANHGALLDADVLKASHHGSDNGTSAGWLAAVSPERVVISAGVHGGFKHPHAGAVTAYEQAAGDDDWVYCTNRHGTITIYGYADGRIRVRRQRITNKSCAYDGTAY